jgi:hypothetical protein
VDILYIEFGGNRFVGLAAIGKNITRNGRTDGRTDGRTQTKIIVPRFRSGTKKQKQTKPRGISFCQKVMKNSECRQEKTK